MTTTDDGSSRVGAATDSDTGEPGGEVREERRRGERRSGLERRGVLRWDPRAGERERRSGGDRRRGPGNHTRQ